MSAAEHYPFPEEERTFDSPTQFEPTVPREVFFRRSDDISKLTEALAKAQLGFAPIKKTIENAFYTTDKKKAMYADLAAIIAATQKPLAENGIVLIQSPVVLPATREAGCRTLISHSSGQWLENEIVLPAVGKFKEYDANGKWQWKPKFDAQTCGIAITYSRRYSYGPMVGVASEEDDDGNGIGEAAIQNGSKETAQAIGKRRLEEVKTQINSKPGISLFWTWNEQDEKAYVHGPRALLAANKELMQLKGKWVSKYNAFCMDHPSLEDVKAELANRKVLIQEFKGVLPNA